MSWTSSERPVYVEFTSCIQGNTYFIQTFNKNPKFSGERYQNIRNKTTGNILQTKEETAMIYWKTNLIKEV